MEIPFIHLVAASWTFSVYLHVNTHSYNIHQLYWHNLAPLSHLACAAALNWLPVDVCFAAYACFKPSCIFCNSEFKSFWMLVYDWEQRLFPHGKYNFQRIAPIFINFVIGTEEKKREMTAVDVYSIATSSVYIRYRIQLYLFFFSGDNIREGFSLFIQLFPL